MLQDITLLSVKAVAPVVFVYQGTSEYIITLTPGHLSQSKVEAVFKLSSIFQRLFESESINPQLALFDQ